MTRRRRREGKRNVWNWRDKHEPHEVELKDGAERGSGAPVTGSMTRPSPGLKVRSEKVRRIYTHDSYAAPSNQHPAYCDVQ